MKVGDKIYCKESRINLYNDNYLYENIVTKGKWYIITEIDNEHIRISSDAGLFFKYRLIFNELYYSFDDFFMTIKELRKLKLKKINERI